MNQVHIIGNITRDVEIKYAQSGTAIANISVAVNKKVKNQQGGYDDKPVYIDVTAFGKTAETLNQYFRKGSKIGIDGELNFEQWQDQQGQKRSKLSVIMNRLHFIDKKDDSQQQQPQQQQQPYNPQAQQQQSYAPQQQQPAQQGYNQPQQQQKQQPEYRQPNQQNNNNQQQSYQAPQQQQKPSYNQPQQQNNNNQQPQQQINEDEIPF